MCDFLSSLNTIIGIEKNRDNMMKTDLLQIRNAILQLIFLLLPVTLASENISLSVNEGAIVYHPDSLGNRVLDYSYCGYKQSDVPIPMVGNAVFIPFQEGDASTTIQKAIQYVENLPMNAKGFRGAVLLDRGIFTLNQSLTIQASGVVLRGSGEGETILRKNGFDRGACIRLEGVNDLIVTDTLDIATSYLPVNSRILQVDDPTMLKEQQQLIIYRPSSQEWIERLGCDHFGGGITYLGWKPGEMDLFWDRRIKAITGNMIELDAPLTMVLDSEETAPKFLLYTWSGRISQSGVENLTIESSFDPANPKDEDHCWTGISIENATDCWVRQMNFKQLAGSAVIIQSTGSQITVEDCISTAPISEIGGMRRNTFLTMGQLTLFQRCYSEEGIHDFAAGHLAAGPNAFVQCESRNSYGFSGAIDSWACGLLYDIVNIDRGDLRFTNLRHHANGAGWATANSLFWQCTAAEIECFSPDSANKNRAYGCWAQFSGDGEWSESNNHLQPRSFFYAQLTTRLNQDISDRARIMPVSTSATSSPTITQAMELTQLSTEPKRTLRAWIEENMGLVDQHHERLLTSDLIIDDVEESHPIENRHNFQIINSRISFRDQLLTGGAAQVQWWSGKLRRPFLEKALPHVTRFVPGREGRGLTDRINSVIREMKLNQMVVLDHNYGLWYDRRRDDHERVRRKDGEVWGPFYEQPFARSGKGAAWDGLSKYDLTKPNKWYWSRLYQFASGASDEGILLFNQHYFQHNILEAGAHWVDSPWRTENNVNNTQFPEPVPFAGDKRIFFAELFYDVEHPVRKELHRIFVRENLNQLGNLKNVVHLTSAEYTGPFHFTAFWIDQVAQWQHDTGKDVWIGLSATKDVQDAILSDPDRSAVVDLIDIRYWHFKDGGELYAPEGGRNMAPRQFARQMKVGKVTFDDVYRAVRSYRENYPEKAVTYYAQGYKEHAWAIFMAGGSLPWLPSIEDDTFLMDALQMDRYAHVKGESVYYSLEKTDIGKIIFSNHVNKKILIPLASGIYRVKSIDPASGKITTLIKSVRIDQGYQLEHSSSHSVYWFQKIK
jgi:hypothetical protein